ncbi:MAG: bifunctional 5,10-methylenetetrahydrofolate dehydrogenase/5,10-methenyltetrahydrofolate cyclohydrolase [Candidatus Cloacimonetes bacterium]|nr:bifunctional 5,10-methylenetetrahydrofolate dehydrogenase/5,10-methenyltetrahydrofolate cyclohydrolase [Candidatus Cloacimonadota bacterium]
MEKELRAKPLVKSIYEDLTNEISSLEIKPQLTILMIGEDPAAEFYVSNIQKNSGKVGILADLQKLPPDLSEDDLLRIIHDLNNDSQVHAIMVQKPLPKHINDNLVAATISPFKDADGFNPVNLGNMLLEAEALLPSTPAAVIEMIRYYQINLTGKHTVLCGRSHIVGKPLANLLLNKQEPGNATVTVCHSKTANLGDYTKQADILITALGIARFIKGDMIKDGVIILDVGTNEVIENGNRFYTGDVDYEDCYQKAAAITPVPGGIGSVTTAMLLKNVWKAYQMQK